MGNNGGVQLKGISLSLNRPHCVSVVHKLSREKGKRFPLKEAMVQSLSGSNQKLVDSPDCCFKQRWRLSRGRCLAITLFEVAHR